MYSNLASIWYVPLMQRVDHIPPSQRVWRYGWILKCSYRTCIGWCYRSGCQHNCRFGCHSIQLEQQFVLWSMLQSQPSPNNPLEWGAPVGKTNQSPNPPNKIVNPHKIPDKLLWNFRDAAAGAKLCEGFFSQIPHSLSLSLSLQHSSAACYGVLLWTPIP